MDLRKDSKNKHQDYKRSERFYQLGNAWFFNYRKGKHMGPYDSDVIAELEVIKFLRAVSNTQSSSEHNGRKVA